MVELQGFGAMAKGQAELESIKAVLLPEIEKVM